MMPVRWHHPKKVRIVEIRCRALLLEAAAPHQRNRSGVVAWAGSRVAVSRKYWLRRRRFWYWVFLLAYRARKSSSSSARSSEGRWRGIGL